MKRFLTSEDIKSVILGHAVGDALGVPVEFRSREFLKQDPVTGMTGFGTYPVPAGSWSDDTSMTLCALDSLAKGRFDPEDIMRKFGDWYYRNEYTPTGKTFDVGSTCRNAISNYFEKQIDIRHCGLSEERANGNGSLMRILPFALYVYSHPDRLKELTDVGSSLTHSHLRTRIACYLYSLILIGLLETKSLGAVQKGTAKAARIFGNTEDWRFYEKLASIGKRPVWEIRSSGYVVDTLEAAVWCLLTTGSYQECVLKAVNLGEDTDTVASVAGGLAGALYGYGAIPEEWLSALKKRENIEDLCEKAAENWGTPENGKVSAD